MTPSSDHTDVSDSTSPDAARSVLSVLLVIHLLIVFVALTSHVSPSTLQSRLLGLFSPYVQPLNFELSSGGRSDARFYLTRTTTGDIPAELEITVQGEGEADDTILVLPSPDRSWGPRARREQALVSVYAELSADEDIASLLSSSIGRAVMAEHSTAEHKAKRATIVCRRPALRENTQQSGFMPAPLHDERFEIVQQGKLKIIDGVVNFDPVVSRGRAAQVGPRASRIRQTRKGRRVSEDR